MYLSNPKKKLCVEIVQQPHKLINNGLKTNISELNRVISLLDLSFEVILEKLDEDTNSSIPAGELKKLPISNSFTGSSSDAAKVTEDLEHLLTSLSQYKLNDEALSGHLYEQNDLGSTSDYLYSEQLPSSRNSNGSAIKSTTYEDNGRTSTDCNKIPSILICNLCKDPIYNNSISALGSNWHQHHFLCEGCQMKLETQVYYVDNDKAYCEVCHINLFTNKCAYCGEAILDTSLTALEQYWHPEHFFCSSCQGPFSDDAGFHEQQGKPYCSECYFELFGHRCGGCNHPITSSFITALGKKWHNECFICAECKMPFESFNFREVNGEPYCEHHYHVKMGTICGSCKKPIIGSLVSALGIKYHVECFTCSYCLKKLAKGSFKENNNRPYCTECFAKLCP